MFFLNIALRDAHSASELAYEYWKISARIFFALSVVLNWEPIGRIWKKFNCLSANFIAL